MLDEARPSEPARHDAYGSVGLNPDPEWASLGVRALHQLADFCEAYPVQRSDL